MDSRKINNRDKHDKTKMASRTLPAEMVAMAMRVPHVKTGYRPMYQPISYYIWSLFYWHNETVNVWTHFIGCLCMLSMNIYYFKIYSSNNSPLRWTLMGHGLCCCLTLLNSGIAHLLHSRSCYMNFVVFMFDYIGVVNWGFGTAILAIYGVSHESTYRSLSPHYIKIQLILHSLAYLVMCVSKLRYGHDLHIKSRKYVIILALSVPGLGNVMPWFQRYVDCYNTEHCSIISLNHITVVCFLFLLVALSFMMHQPETCWPGRFDYIGHSHQIFHVLVIVTQALQIRCLYTDYLNGANVHCEPDFKEILFYIVMLYGCCGASLLYLCTHINETVATKDKRR